MKRIIKLVVLCLLVTQGFSQVALLDKTYDFIQTREFLKVENAILLAEKNISTANDARTYYLKAFIYKELMLINEGAAREKFRNICISSIERCNQLDHDRSFKQPVKQLHDFILASLYNEGVENYNGQVYPAAVDHFKKYIAFSLTEDTYWLDAHYYIGSSFYSLQQHDSARVYLELSKVRNYDQPILYVDLSYLYLGAREKAKAMETIAQGLSMYPEFLDIRIAELNILSGFQSYDTLEIRIEDFLKKNPNHIEVLLMAGSLYEKTGNDETRQAYRTKSEQAYQRVISIDSQNFDANYNLGVLYYNEAVDIVNKNDLETDIATLTKVLEHSTKLFERSLPFLLKIHNPSVKNLKLLHALQAIYYNLNMKTELAEINTLIKEVGQG